MALLSDARALEADRAVADFFQAQVFNEIGNAVNAGLDREIREELEDAVGAAVAAGAGASKQVSGIAYCRYVLRGKECPYGMSCRLRHFAARPDGSAAPSVPEVEREALSCGICGQIFQMPVTLACGHTFDRECLLQLKKQQQCPVDRKPFKLPLPEIDFAIRAYVEAQFPEDRPGSEQAMADESTKQSTRMGAESVPARLSRGWLYKVPLLVLLWALLAAWKQDFGWR